MGRPMAINVLRAGYAAVCWARRAESMAPVIAAGATGCGSPAEVAARSDVIVTNVSDSPDLEEVILGANGIADGVNEGAVVVDHSTVSPMVTRVIAAALAARGAHMLDAPVSGGDTGAVQASLTMLVGGEAHVYERLRPLFACNATHVRRVGESGAGQVAKACNQIAVSVTLEAVAEALTLARRSGVDPARVRDAMLGGYAWSRILDEVGARMLTRDFTPGFKARLHAKDLNICLLTAHALGLPLPLTAQVAQHMNAVHGAGNGDSDWASIVTVLERMGRVAA